MYPPPYIYYMGADGYGESSRLCNTRPKRDLNIIDKRYYESLLCAERYITEGLSSDGKNNHNFKHWY